MSKKQGALLINALGENLSVLSYLPIKYSNGQSAYDREHKVLNFNPDFSGANTYVGLIPNPTGDDSFIAKCNAPS